MMIRTERSILGVVVHCPEFREFFFENCDRELFQEEQNREVFDVLKSACSEKHTLDWPVFLDKIGGRVNASYLTSLQDCTEGLYPSGVEDFLSDKISLLKEERLEREVLGLINKELIGGNRVKLDKIKELMEKAEIFRVGHEKGDVQTAYEEYLGWIRKERTNIITGFPTFDRLTDDYYHGEMVCLAARTTVGKTWISLNILSRLITHVKEAIGYFSMEMARPTLIERMLQLHLDCSRWDLKDKVKADELKKEYFIAEYKNLRIYEQVYSVSEMTRLIKRDGLKIVFIDFLQLVRKSGSGGIYEETTHLVQELKEMAKNEQIVIFLLSQISRKGEGGWEPVELSMLRDSGAIEELNDFIIGIWDPSLNPGLKEEQKPKFEGKLFLKLLKNKRGPQISIECIFDKNTGKIYEIEKGDFS